MQLYNVASLGILLVGLGLEHDRSWVSNSDGSLCAVNHYLKNFLMLCILHVHIFCWIQIWMALAGTCKLKLHAPSWLRHSLANVVSVLCCAVHFWLVSKFYLVTKASPAVVYTDSAKPFTCTSIYPITHAQVTPRRWETRPLVGKKSLA